MFFRSFQLHEVCFKLKNIYLLPLFWDLYILLVLFVLHFVNLSFSQLSGFFIYLIYFTILFSLGMQSIVFSIAHNMLLNANLLVRKFSYNVSPWRFINLNAFTLLLFCFRVEPIRNTWKLSRVCACETSSIFSYLCLIMFLRSFRFGIGLVAPL